MPELPEVETVMRGLSPHVQGACIQRVRLRCSRLRWPIPDDLDTLLSGHCVQRLWRRGKYLLFELDHGTLIIHLGMSGRLCLVREDTPIQKHDHVDIILADQSCLRYADPRRFGAILWTSSAPMQHPLLHLLGVEPLTESFTAEYLMQKAANRRRAIKPLLMDSHVVVGIGNIYAAEALFLVGIHPAMPAGMLTLVQAQRLVSACKQVLNHAIDEGGTTLKDFVNGLGTPGYFSQKLNVYGRDGLPCVQCHRPLVFCLLGQRRSVFCEHCQRMGA